MDAALVDHSRDAQIIAGVILLAITFLLLATGRKRSVARQEITWNDSGGTSHTIKKGWVVPPGATVPGDQVEDRRVSAFRLLYLGKDNRASTSKAVALAWTYAVAYGLISLLAARVLGADKPWDEQIENGLQENYLLLLGGPYAAAVIAKYTAVSTDGGTNKTTSPETSTGGDVKDLISDDDGDTDLGDFQYILFNLIALAFFFSEFVPHLDNGLPDLPSALVGLALTSAGGYAAKKAAVSAAGPQLTSVFPDRVAVGAVVEIWGRGLVHAGEAPRVSIGGVPSATVEVISTTGTADKLKAVVPQVTSGEQQVRVMTSAGAPALTTGGTDHVTVTIV